MAAITIAPTPIKGGTGKGFWVNFKEDLITALSLLADNSSNLNTATNTIDELTTVVASIVSTPKVG